VVANRHTPNHQNKKLEKKAATNEQKTGRTGERKRQKIAAIMRLAPKRRATTTSEQWRTQRQQTKDSTNIDKIGKKQAAVVVALKVAKAKLDATTSRAMAPGRQTHETKATQPLQVLCMIHLTT
jgi:hypothetical protein